MCKKDISYTVHDVRRAQVSLEPLRCLHCDYVGLFYSQRLRDAYCPSCGRWQIEKDNNDD